MEKLYAILVKEGFPFFGQMNATISHELKNIMATISETSGLINDLIEVSGNGKNIDLDLIKNSSQAVVEEVQRGFKTIKQMNVFAHSVDNLLYEIDLGDTIELMVNLSHFLSYSSRVDLNRKETTQGKIFTCPFLLQHLIYDVLKHAYRLVGHKGLLSVTVLHEEKRHAVIFDNVSHDEKTSFPDERVQDIALVLGVTISTGEDGNGIVLDIPATLKPGVSD